ncbi:hypothetical protein EDD21DRAFT_442360 [Dissophora ornata]|nr:hypothetical protein EDD21DRAFT_442360 [Dissophora ornata]
MRAMIFSTGMAAAGRGYSGGGDHGLNSYIGKRVVVKMAYMQDSINDEDQLLQHLHYQKQQQRHQQQQRFK